MSKDTMRQALIAAFKANESDTEAAAEALTAVMCAFADVVRGEPLEAFATELVADNTQALILAELRTQTALLHRLAGQHTHQILRGDVMNCATSIDTSGLPG